MFGVFADRYNEGFTDCFGVSSCGEVPLFHRNLYNFIRSNVFDLNISESVVFSNNSNIFETDDKYVSHIKELSDLEEKSAETEYAVFFLDSFFVIDSELFMSGKNKFDKFLICDDTGNIYGVFCNKKAFGDYVRKHKENREITRSDFISEDTFPVVKCVKYGVVLEGVKDYKKLVHHILNSELSDFLPETAEGIFTSHQIPKGDYVIVPPVYFGKDIQVESGSVIGPDTVVYDSVLIASDTTVKRSLIMNNCYISSGCFIDDTVCCNNVSVRRNSAIFSGAIIGARSLLGEECLLENDTEIPPESYVDFYKDNDFFTNRAMDEYGGFYGYTPHKAALLGLGMGSVFSDCRVGVCSDGELNSTALKLTLIGGLMAGGAECYDFGCSFSSSLHYFVDFCQLDYGVFISGNDTGTVIFITDKNGDPIGKGDRLKIKNAMLSSDLKTCSRDRCKGIRAIRGMHRIYLNELVKNFSKELPFYPVLNCGNKRINKIFNIAVSKIGYNRAGEEIVFNINEFGTNVTVSHSDKKYNQNIIEGIVSFFSESEAFFKPYIWRNDAVLMSFILMNILAENETDLISAAAKIPDVYIAERGIYTDIAFSKIATCADKISNIRYKNGIIESDDDNVRIKYQQLPGKRIRILVKAASFEMAEETAADVVRLFERYKS